MRKKLPEKSKRGVKVSFMTTPDIAEAIQKEAEIQYSGNVSLYLHIFAKNNIQEKS